MTRKVATVNKSLSIKELSKLFIENRFNGIPVRNYNDNVIGAVTQEDLILQNMNLHIPYRHRFVRCGTVSGKRKEI